jgi:predicted nucleic acid-binding protein
MIYVDTSVVVALLTLEPSTQAVKTWYAGLDEMPVCSDWLLPEASSAISIKVRTGQISEATAKSVRKEFALLTDGGVRIVPVSRNAFVKAMEMTKIHNRSLRAGDSLHLAVALELGASHMATLDAMLAENAKRHGMEIIKL